MVGPTPSRKALSRGQTAWCVAGCLFVIGTFVGVSVNEELQKVRRHSSIAKDIEREKWRATQLGLETRDDGFAETYMNDLIKKKGHPTPAITATNTLVALTAPDDGKEE